MELNTFIVMFTFVATSYAIAQCTSQQCDILVATRSHCNPVIAPYVCISTLPGRDETDTKGCHFDKAHWPSSGICAESCDVRSCLTRKYMYVHITENLKTCEDNGMIRISTPEECLLAAKHLGYPTEHGFTSDWSRSNVFGGCIYEADKQDVDFNSNLGSNAVHSDRQAICKQATDAEPVCQRDIDIGRGVSVTSYNINGECANEVKVNQGESLNIHLEYFNPEEGCTGCLEQVLVGIQGRELDCVYHGNPSGHISDDYQLRLDDLEPGTYTIVARATFQFSCLSFTDGTPIAVVHVIATNQCTTTFFHTLNAAISGHNRLQLTDVTVDDCEVECCAQAWCKSFDYYKNEQICDLSDHTAQETGGLKRDYRGNPYDHYSTVSDECTASFFHTPNTAISGHNRLQLTDVTVDDCKAECCVRDWCKSFDYHNFEQSCDLSDHTAQEAGGLKTDYLGNPYDHYSIVSDEPYVLGNTGQSCAEVCSGFGKICSWDLSGVTRDTFKGLLSAAGLGICRDDAGCDHQGEWFANDQPAFVATGMGDANEQCCLGYKNIPTTGVDCDYSIPTVKRVCKCEGTNPNEGGVVPVIPIGGNYPNFPHETWGQYEVEYEGQTCNVKSYAGDYFDNVLFKVSNLGFAQCSDATTVFAGQLHILPRWFRDTEFNLFVECPNGVCTATIPLGIAFDACDAIMFATTLGTGNAAAAVKGTSTGIGAKAQQLYQTLKDTAQALKTTVKNFAKTNAPRLTKALKEAQKANQRFTEAKQKVTDQPTGTCETYGGYASQLLKANERTASLGDIVDNLLDVISDLFGSVYITVYVDFDLVVNHRIFGGNSNAPLPVASQASKLTLGWNFGTAFCAIPTNTALCIAIGILTDIDHDLKICTQVEFVFDFPTATQILGGKSEWKDVTIELKCLESATATEIALESWNKLESLIKSVGIDTDKLGLSGIKNGLEFFEETLSGYRERLCPEADFTDVVANALFLDKVFPIERAICTQGDHGTWCLRNYECKSHVCSLGRCANKGKKGSICNTHSDCVSNYCSNVFQCSDKSNGSPCARNKDCNSERCELGRLGKCAAREKNGHMCNEDSDCLSKNCFFFFCRSSRGFFGRRLMQHELMSPVRQA